ncbi:MAG: hypothetical protein JF593_01880 [Novosphingobium sp.]|nr:hypothetical protein [Novosphingobium sp.]
MTRILLALLALISGFAVPTAVAQARMTGHSDMEIGAPELPHGSGRCVGGQAASIEAPVVERAAREREASRVRPARARVYIPAVQLGSDRALE